MCELVEGIEENKKKGLRMDGAHLRLQTLYPLYEDLRVQLHPTVKGPLYFYEKYKIYSSYNTSALRSRISSRVVSICNHCTLRVRDIRDTSIARTSTYLYDLTKDMY